MIRGSSTTGRSLAIVLRTRNENVAEALAEPRGPLNGCGYLNILRGSFLSGAK